MSKSHDKPITDEYFALWVMIAQTKDGLLRARQRDYARFNISNERRAVLWSIQNNGGEATPVEIARQLFRELHSVSEMLVRMEKEGPLKDVVEKIISDLKKKKEEEQDYVKLWENTANAS